MSEETEAAENGSAAGLAGADPAALALALGGASRARADAFLDNQNALIADQRRMLHLQMEEFEEEKPLKLSHLRIRRFGDYTKMAFEFSIGLLMLALVGGVAVMVWNAAHADGLIIESFSVPPDLTAKGVTGEVAASQLLDKLIAIQNQSTSVRPTKSYANSWGDDVKVEIPDTGVSVGEAYRFLRGWLGHETHVSGEITRTATGIAITTRTGRDDGVTFIGPETDLDTLVQESAEHVFRVIQPDRYARYLMFPRPGTIPRYDEARVILNQVIAEGSPAEKSWAWGGLGNLANIQGDYRASAFANRRAIAANPDNLLPYSNLANVEAALSHPESALSAARSAARMLDQGSPDIIPTYVGRVQTQNRFLVTFLQGDYLAAAGLARSGVELPVPRNTANFQFFQDNTGYVLSLLHDGAGVRVWWAGAAPPETPQNRVRRATAQLQAAGGLQDWRSVTASAAQIESQVSALGVAANFARLLMETQLRPLLALAKARLGDVAGAEALIATTPGDCYDCTRMRGTIAGLANQPRRADYWFARAVHDAPSIPFAYADWGQMLLERGQPDAAIAKFTIANRCGPRFADPLEMWGEALMAKNQSHLALPKFAEAEKYAPNWGRLHLKWGEALVYAGKPDEAKKHFARAAQLDLTPAETSELARQGVRHA